MNSNRRTATIAGVLFILATAASLLSVPFLAPVSATNYLVSVSANGNQVAAGVFLIIVGAFASASIAISLYPVLRQKNQSLALGAVGFRLIEGVLYIVSVISLLSLLTLSTQFVNEGAPDSAYFRDLGALLLGGYHWVGYAVAPLAFAIGAFLYYVVFYQSRLIPRWLSGWGLVATPLLMISCVLVLFSLIGPLSPLQLVFAFPIAVQEMVLAVWLIFKGFISPALASEGGKS